MKNYNNNDDFQIKSSKLGRLVGALIATGVIFALIISLL